MFSAGSQNLFEHAAHSVPENGVADKNASIFNKKIKKNYTLLYSPPIKNVSQQ